MGPKFTSMWFSCIFIKCCKSSSILTVSHIILNGGRSKGQRSKVTIQKLFGISSRTSDYRYHHQRSNGSWAMSIQSLHFQLSAIAPPFGQWSQASHHRRLAWPSISLPSFAKTDCTVQPEQHFLTEEEEGRKEMTKTTRYQVYNLIP